MNRNGINYLNVPVFVEPINDPPFIHVPEFIILKNSKEDGSLIFDREQDKFEFFIGDPDLLYVPGMFSIFNFTIGSALKCLSQMKASYCKHRILQQYILVSNLGNKDVLIIKRFVARLYVGLSCVCCSIKNPNSGASIS